MLLLVDDPRYAVGNETKLKPIRFSANQNNVLFLHRPVAHLGNDHILLDEESSSSILRDGRAITDRYGECKQTVCIRGGGVVRPHHR